MTGPSAHAVGQYAATTANLSARIAAHEYGTNPQSWWSWLDDRLPRDGRVLEVGAGTGELWRHVDRKASALTLADFSPAMCDRLRVVPGARVVRCDAAALPFPDGAFDTVIANHMLYHLDDPAVALREFARVLRPGGRVAVATNGADHMTDLDAIGPRIGRPDIALGLRQNDFTAENGAAYVSRYFADVTVERYPADLAVPTSGPVLAYLASMASPPLTPAQSAAAHELIRARIDAEGTFRVRKHTVLLAARRP
jgi:SAM-dependent methyltransferase